MSDEPPPVSDHDIGSRTGTPVTDVLGRRLLQEATDLVLVVAGAALLGLVADRATAWVTAAFPPRFSSSEQGDAYWGWLDAVHAFRAALPFVLVAWWVLYIVVVPWLLRARTPGMLLLRLTMVRKDGTSAGFVAILLRAIGVAAETVVLMIIGSLALGAWLGALVAVVVVPCLVIALTTDHVRIAERVAGVLVAWSPRGVVVRR